MKYWKAVNVIQAREYLLKMNLADYPSMKKEERKKFYREMKGEAYPVHMQKTLDYDDFARKIGALND
jgi:hypothetical protein